MSTICALVSILITNPQPDRNTHNAIEASEVGRPLHHLRTLAVIHVDSDRHLCVLRRLCSGVEEQTIRVLNRPREQL